jgi:hypothetical protein
MTRQCYRTPVKTTSRRSTYLWKFPGLLYLADISRSPPCRLTLSLRPLPGRVPRRSSVAPTDAIGWSGRQLRAKRRVRTRPNDRHGLHDQRHTLPYSRRRPAPRRRVHGWSCAWWRLPKGPLSRLCFPRRFPRRVPRRSSVAPIDAVGCSGRQVRNRRPRLRLPRRRRATAAERGAPPRSKRRPRRAKRAAPLRPKRAAPPRPKRAAPLRPKRAAPPRPKRSAPPARVASPRPKWGALPRPKWQLSPRAPCHQERRYRHRRRSASHWPPRPWRPRH